VAELKHEIAINELLSQEMNLIASGDKLNDYEIISE